MDGETLPQAPLWGRPVASDSVGELEADVLKPYVAWCEGLEFSGMQQERRNLVLRPENMGWQLAPNELLAPFELPRGTFATVVLRELAQLHPPSGKPVL